MIIVGILIVCGSCLVGFSLGALFGLKYAIENYNIENDVIM